MKTGAKWRTDRQKVNKRNSNKLTNYLDLEDDISFTFTPVWLVHGLAPNIQHAARPETDGKVILASREQNDASPFIVRSASCALSVASHVASGVSHEWRRQYVGDRVHCYTVLNI